MSIRWRIVRIIVSSALNSRYHSPIHPEKYWGASRPNSSDTLHHHRTSNRMDEQRGQSLLVIIFFTQPERRSGRPWRSLSTVALGVEQRLFRASYRL